MLLGLAFVTRAYALHRKKSVLGPAIAFFADAALLTPQVAVNGVALSHFVVTEALRERKFAAIAEFAQQTQHFPLDVSGRLLGRIAEIDFVFDLQSPQLRLKQRQFFVNGHTSSPSDSLWREGRDDVGNYRAGTKVIKASYARRASGRICELTTGVGGHLLDHGQHQFAIAVVQAHGITANLAEETYFIV